MMIQLRQRWWTIWFVALLLPLLVGCGELLLFVEEEVVPAMNTAVAATPPATNQQPNQQPTQPEPSQIPDEIDGIPVITYDQLPPEAWATLALIHAGGPFPYNQDDSTFQNRERLLPLHPRGYYREYTVETPGARNRAARRIVAGEGGEFYYTDDHYASFWRIWNPSP
jgi:ribonuclease T1